MKSAIEQNEFRKWLETMSVKASYSDQRELLRVVLKHYDDSLAQEKPTAPASRERLAHCPTCQGEIKSTERRPDGDSVCINGHKHKTAEFFRYRPAPSSDEGLWEELNDLYKKSLYHPGLCLNVMGAYDVKDLLDKYRHPSTKSDRCGETVREIRQRVTDYFNQSAWPTEFMKYAHMVSDKMHDILDEFSEDADGTKEGR